jgi:hypothetical protein
MIRRDHDQVRDLRFERTPRDRADEGLSAEETKRLVGESAGVQPGRNDTEDRHGKR